MDEVLGQLVSALEIDAFRKVAGSCEQPEDVTKLRWFAAMAASASG